AGETAVDLGDQPRQVVPPHRREPAGHLVPRRRFKLEGRRAVQHLAPVQGGDVAEVLRTGVADGWGHRSVLAAPSRTVSGFAPGVCYSAALLGEVESVRMILTAAVAACLVTPAPAPAVAQTKSSATRATVRSEERRVGKEGRHRRSPWQTASTE